MFAAAGAWSARARRWWRPHWWHLAKKRHCPSTNEPKSESHQIQPHRGGELLLPCVRADELLEIAHGSPPRVSRTSSLSGLPGGCSPQIALARARKSDRGAALAGTTLAMTLSVRHQSSNLSAQQTPDAGEP